MTNIVVRALCPHYNSLKHSAAEVNAASSGAVSHVSIHLNTVRSLRVLIQTCQTSARWLASSLAAVDR